MFVQDTNLISFMHLQKQTCPSSFLLTSVLFILPRGTKLEYFTTLIYCLVTQLLYSIPRSIPFLLEISSYIIQCFTSHIKQIFLKTEHASYRRKVSGTTLKHSYASSIYIFRATHLIIIFSVVSCAL